MWKTAGGLAWDHPGRADAAQLNLHQCAFGEAAVLEAAERQPEFAFAG